MEYLNDELLFPSFDLPSATERLNEWEFQLIQEIEQNSIQDFRFALEFIIQNPSHAIPILQLDLINDIFMTIPTLCSEEKILSLRVIILVILYNRYTKFNYQMYDYLQSLDLWGFLSSIIDSNSEILALVLEITCLILDRFDFSIDLVIPDNIFLKSVEKILKYPYDNEVILVKFTGFLIKHEFVELYSDFHIRICNFYIFLLNEFPFDHIDRNYLFSQIYLIMQSCDIFIDDEEKSFYKSIQDTLYFDMFFYSLDDDTLNEQRNAEILVTNAFRYFSSIVNEEYIETLQERIPLDYILFLFNSSDINKSVLFDLMIQLFKNDISLIVTIIIEEIVNWFIYAKYDEKCCMLDGLNELIRLLTADQIANIIIHFVDPFICFLDNNIIYPTLEIFKQIKEKMLEEDYDEIYDEIIGYFIEEDIESVADNMMISNTEMEEMKYIFGF